MAGLSRGGGLRIRDAFTDPVVLPMDGALCLGDVQAVVRALSRAAAMSPALTSQLIAGVTALAGSLCHGSSQEGRLLLRLMRDGASVGMEVVLECEGEALRYRTLLADAKRLWDECQVVAGAGGASRLVARKWEPSTTVGMSSAAARSQRRPPYCSPRFRVQFRIVDDPGGEYTHDRSVA